MNKAEIKAVMTLGLIAALFTIVSFFLFGLPKKEICETYYREISLYSCMVSDYGLPHRGGK